MNTQYVQANNPHIPSSAVIGGEDYAKNHARVTPRGSSLWLSKGRAYRLSRDYNHKWSEGCNGPYFLTIPAGSRISLHRAGSPEDCAVWKVEMPKGKTIS